MKLKIVDYNKKFEPENTLTTHLPLADKEFAEKGVYSKVIFGEDKDIDQLAWIDLAPYSIINPLLFNIVKQCIPKLQNMIEYQKPIDQNGNEVEPEEDEELNKLFIGLQQFKEEFDEILEKSVNKNKHGKEYNFILQNRDKVFIDKIPVFSDKLRPAKLINKDLLIFSEINTYYNFIIQYNTELHDDLVFDKNLDILELPLLYNIQSYANILHTKIINEFIKGKKGFIRKNIFGARLNFSARNIITPIIGKRINKVDMPYRTFLELYKFQLINLISISKNINYNEAHEFWKKATTHFNKEMYSYVKELISKTKGKCMILLNRNPTISIGSILFLEIDHVKTNYNDFTLGISNNILNSFSGDYDGDTLNILPVFDNHMKEVFKLLSPSNFIVDRNNGNFNSDFDMVKEQVLGLFVLNNK